MVQFVGLESPARFSVIARPNAAAGSTGLAAAMGILLPACGLAGVGFVALGAWPVAVFMALALLALAAAFLHVGRHAGDFERLTLDGGRLILERHAPGADEHLEFNGHWVQVVLQPSATGLGHRLALRSHGRAVPFGRLLSDDERRTVGRELRRRLASLGR